MIKSPNIRNKEKTKELDQLCTKWKLNKTDMVEEKELVRQITRLIGARLFASTLYNCDPNDSMAFLWKRVLKSLQSWDASKSAASTYIYRVIGWGILDLKNRKIKEVASDKFAKNEIAELYKYEINQEVESWRK